MANGLDKPFGAASHKKGPCSTYTGFSGRQMIQGDKHAEILDKLRFPAVKLPNDCLAYGVNVGLNGPQPHLL